MTSRAEEPPAFFIVGTAGSGKTSLASSLADWLNRRGVTTEAVNLDPGADFLPYEPILDARDFVNVYDIMSERGLGPNSSLILAADILADRVDEMRKTLADCTADLFLVDTSGQIELFAFRSSGTYLTRELFWGSKAIGFLVDAPFSTDPMNFLANMFLQSAIYSRLLLPLITIVTKEDLVRTDEISGILDWSKDREILISRTREEYPAEKFIHVESLLRSIPGLPFLSRPIVVSSNTLSGFTELYAEISRLFFAGEETATGPPH